MHDTCYMEQHQSWMTHFQRALIGGRQSAIDRHDGSYSVETNYCHLQWLTQTMFKCDVGSPQRPELPTSVQGGQQGPCCTCCPSTLCWHVDGFAFIADRDDCRATVLSVDMTKISIDIPLYPPYRSFTLQQYFQDCDPAISSLHVLDTNK